MSSADPACPDCGGCGFTRKGSDCQCLGATWEFEPPRPTMSYEKRHALEVTLRRILCRARAPNAGQNARTIASGSATGTSFHTEYAVAKFAAVSPDVGRQVIRAIEEARG